MIGSLGVPSMALAASVERFPKIHSVLSRPLCTHVHLDLREALCEVFSYRVVSIERMLHTLALYAGDAVYTGCIQDK